MNEKNTKKETWICLHCGKLSLDCDMFWDDVAYDRFRRKSKEEQDWELENHTAAIIKRGCQWCQHPGQMVELEKVLDQSVDVGNKLTTLRAFIISHYKIVY